MDRQTDGQTERRDVIAVTLRLCVVVRINKIKFNYELIEHALHMYMYIHMYIGH